MCVEWEAKLVAAYLVALGEEEVCCFQSVKSVWLSARESLGPTALFHALEELFQVVDVLGGGLRGLREDL